MRELEGYRDVLARIRETTTGEMVTVREAAAISGYNPKYVTKRFQGWVGKNHGKRIPATTLARQMVSRDTGR